jgi:hypothetical protein
MANVPDRGAENYSIFTGTHPDDPDTEHEFKVQVRKNKGGKYETRLTSFKAGQTGMHYSSINVGSGYTKRITKNGKTIHKTQG